MYLRKIPLIAGLADCEARDHKEALHELFFTLLGASLPVLIGAWVIVLTAQEALFFQSMLDNIHNGELFLYCTSLVAPIIYMATTNKQGDLEFPTKRSHIAIVFILMIFSSITFGLQRAGIILSNKEFMFKTSVIFFAVSVLLLYLAITYKNKMIPKGPDDMKQQERDFAREYGSHRR